MATDGVQIEIKRPKREQVDVWIVGLTDLICSAAPKVIKDPGAAVKRKKKALAGGLPDETDNADLTGSPEDQCRKSLYYLPDGTPFGFPSAGVQAAIASALERFNPINPKYAKGTKAIVYGATFMLDEMLRIEGEGPIMRHDVARAQHGRKPLVDTYRGSFRGWRMTVRIEVETNVMTIDRLLNALDSAGHKVGIGAWRPERGGRFGRFEVEAA